MNLILQAKIDDAAYKLTDYGPLGIYAFITTAGFVVMVVFIRKKYERHLKEKDEYIAKLERKLQSCEDRIIHMEENIFKQLKESLDHNSDVISENSKAYYETASVVHENKGVLLSLHELMKDKRRP